MKNSERPMRAAALLLSCALMAGCITVPKTTGDSLYTDKLVTFPSSNGSREVKPGGLVHMHANYASRVVFRLSEPLKTRFMLGRISAEVTDNFQAADLEGRKAFCSERRLYSDLLMGPQSVVCISHSASGKLDKIEAQPGAAMLSSVLAAPVKFTQHEMPRPQPGWPLKRELVFDGMSQNVLAFTQRTYEQSLDQPSQIKPHLVRVQTLPMVVLIDGAQLLVTAIGPETVSLQVIQDWR